MKILQIHKILWFALKIASITAASAHVISTSILNLCDVPRGAGGCARVYKLFECV